jgi:hypothetical protein
MELVIGEKISPSGEFWSEDVAKAYRAAIRGNDRDGLGSGEITRKPPGEVSQRLADRSDGPKIRASSDYDLAASITQHDQRVVEVPDGLGGPYPMRDIVDTGHDHCDVWVLRQHPLRLGGKRRRFGPDDRCIHEPNRLA